MGGPSKATAEKTKGVQRGERAPRVDRSKRLLDLVMMLLRARSPVPYRDIREQFVSYQTRNAEAGLRAFERDKADLLELGVPVRYITPDDDDAIEEGGYVIDLKRFRLPEVHFTAEEISALVLAASVARAVPGVSYAQVVDLALKKLAFDLPDPPDTPFDLPLPRKDAGPPVLVHFPHDPSGRDKLLSDRFAQLEAATRNRKRVIMHYQSASNGYMRKREVDPYGLVYREGSWVLIGYCRLRKDVRSFRLDRMVELSIAPKPKSPDFDRPQDFDVRAYANRSPWTFQTGVAETALLQLSPQAAHIAREDFGPSAEILEQEDGGVQVRFSSGNPDYVVSRILASKGSLRLLEGKGVKKRLAEELEAISGAYR